MTIEYKQMSRGKKWFPHRVDLTNFAGEKSIIDVGPAEITVLIKGPYVNLEFNDVQSLTVDIKRKD